MEQEMLMLGWKGYCFEKDGKNVSGAKIHLVNLNPSSSELIGGSVPLTQNVELDYVKSLPYPTGVYNCKFEVVPKNGKAQLEITSLTPIRKVELKKC